MCVILSVPLLAISCGGNGQTDASGSGAAVASGTDAGISAVEPVDGAPGTDDAGTVSGTSTGSGSGKASGDASGSGSDAPMDAGADGIPGDDASQQAAEQAEEARKKEEARIRAIVPGPVEAVPAPGLQSGAVSIRLSCSTPEAKISYTLDGSIPVPGKSPEYSRPFTLDKSAVVTVMAWVPKGQKGNGAALAYTVGEICVAPGGAGAGTRESPAASISAAVDLARKTGIKSLRLARGSFAETVVIDSDLTISGGWDGAWKSRENSRSVIQGAATANSGKKSPGYALMVSGKDASPRLTGLDIRGGEASYAAGTFVTNNARPVFEDCTMTGGDGSFGYGVLVSGSARGSFRDCILSGGIAPSSCGLSVDGASVELRSVTAWSGDGTLSAAGAMVTDGSLDAVSCVFSSGKANTGHGLALYNTRDIKVRSSTLWGGRGRDAIALFVSVGRPVLESCILGAQGQKISCGIWKNYGDSAPASLASLAFTGCATSLYFDADTRIAGMTIDGAGRFTDSAGKALAAPAAPGSLAGSFALGETPWCRTPADAPAVVKTGGVVVDGVSADAGGNPRSAPWSIGAWEAGS